MWHVVGHSPAEKESLAERTFRNCSKLMLTCSSVLDREHMMASMYDLYVSIALYHMVYSQLAACSSGGSVFVGVLKMRLEVAVPGTCMMPRHWTLDSGLNE